MDREVFEKFVTEAIALVPQAIRDKISNVAFVIEDDPRVARKTERQITSRGSLLGLYQGIPLPMRGMNYSGVLPDKITLFQKAIENAAGNDPERIRKLVHEVVHHEIAHYFSMNEREVRAWERKRKKREKGF